MNQFHRIAVKQMTMNRRGYIDASIWTAYPANMTSHDGTSFWIMRYMDTRPIIERLVDELYFRDLFPFRVKYEPEEGELGPV